jgi:hypothetical protein
VANGDVAIAGYRVVSLDISRIGLHGTALPFPFAANNAFLVSDGIGIPD